MKKAILISVLLTLVSAIVLQLLPKRAPEVGRGQHLRQVLPEDLPGWSGTDLPLGQNEAVSGAVEKTLRFDDAYFREFRSGRGTVALYVAYWGPGKMPVQLVSSHTPDRCWVENGWSREKVRHAVAAASAVRPGEWRLFKAPSGQKLNVLFWHVVGDDLYDYGQRASEMPSAWRWWRDAALQAVRPPAEQYFIRVSSDRPFEELAGDAGWQQLLRALEEVGLRAG
ncbi:MAG: hypothetical protein C0518_01010 [Opitutus sp.]|nr:hypothetical protein [Opitutus sp.]